MRIADIEIRSKNRLWLKSMAIIIKTSDLVYVHEISSGDSFNLELINNIKDILGGIFISSFSSYEKNMFYIAYRKDRKMKTFKLDLGQNRDFSHRFNKLTIQKYIEYMIGTGIIKWKKINL